MMELACSIAHEARQLPWPTQGALSELSHIPFRRVPHALFVKVASLLEQKDNLPRHGLVLQITGGACAPVWYYHPLRSNIRRLIKDEMLERRIIIKMPHRMVVSVRGLLSPTGLADILHIRHWYELVGIHAYLELLNGFMNTHTLPAVGVGHSLGGLVKLLWAVLEPGRVHKIVLVGTPVNTALVRSKIVLGVIEQVLGIHLRHAHEIFERLKTALATEEFRRKIIIISSTNDRFCTPDICHIEGATHHILTRPNHVSLPHDPEVAEIVAAIAIDEYRLLRPLYVMRTRTQTRVA